MNILFLYTELAGYFLACVKALSQLSGVNVHVVHWKVNPDAPFNFNFPPQVQFYCKDTASRAQLEDLCLSIQPDLVFIAGWLDKDYLHIARKFKNVNIPIVGGLDNQWRGDLRQKLACIVSPFYIKHIFTHLWVPGLRQYEFARRLGWAPHNILTRYYCADVHHFNAIYNHSRQQKQIEYPRTLLYVGRFNPVKGVDLLVKSFQELIHRHDWNLHLVGAGKLNTEISLEAKSRIIIQDFVQPELLPELAVSAGAFILPSIIEPWGVVLHEFAAAGLPLIATDACGSANAFLIEDYNGFTFQSGNEDSLKKAILKLVALSEDELISFGKRSVELSLQLTPEAWSKTLLSVIK